MNRQEIISHAAKIMAIEYEDKATKKGKQEPPEVNLLLGEITDKDPELLKEILILKPFIKTKSTKILGNEESQNELVEKILFLREFGLSSYAIGKIVGISHTTVNKILKERGYSGSMKETNELKSRKLREIIYRLYVDIGFSMKEISKVIGITELTVRKHLHSIAKADPEKAAKINEMKKINRGRPKNKSYG